MGGYVSRDPVSGQLMWYPDDGSDPVPYDGSQDGGAGLAQAGGATQGATTSAGGLFSPADAAAGLTAPASSGPAATTGGSTAGTTKAGAGVYDPANPVPGTRIPGTNIVYLGDDVSGTPKFTNAGRSTTVVNGKLVDTETGQVIADYGRAGTGAAGASVQAEQIRAQQQVLDRERLSQEFQQTYGLDKQKADQLAQYQQAQLQQNQMDLAEKQRQFNLDLAQKGQGLDVQRGNKLLEIGSRPETLLRYLYAIRGLQAPQGGQTSALPGYSPGNYGAPPAYPPLGPQGIGAPPPDRSVTGISIPEAASGKAVPAPVTVPEGQQGPPGFQSAPGIGAQTFGAPVTIPQAQQNHMIVAPTSVQTAGPKLAPVTIPGLTSQGQTVSYDPRFGLQNTAAINQAAYAANPSTVPKLGPTAGGGVQTAGGFFGSAANAKAAGFDKGGVIPEPVIGRGLVSGQIYTFNEDTLQDPSKAETVVPAGKTLAEVKDKAGTKLRSGGKIAAKSPKTVKAGTSGSGPKSLARSGMQMAGMNNMMRMPVRGAEAPGVGMGQNGMGMNLPGAYRKGGVIGYEAGGSIGFEVPVPGEASVGEAMGNRLGTKGYDVGQMIGGPPRVGYPDLSGLSATSRRVAPGAPINMFALGGTLGYDSSVPHYAMSPSLFNPTGLSTLANAAELSPGVPNLPQLGAATGGTSLIPSAQRWASLLPSEQKAYQGIAQDQFGVQPEDLDALTKKLSPSALSTFTPLGRVLRGLSESTYGQGEKS
ncbi:MAG: hypothetical protein KGI98_15560 [Euryarchaeota archaeon]|nr:hypothetical protein [Euryarchaeota archaeon]